MEKDPCAVPGNLVTGGMGEMEVGAVRSIQCACGELEVQSSYRVSLVRLHLSQTVRGKPNQNGGGDPQMEGVGGVYSWGGGGLGRILLWEG